MKVIGIDAGTSTIKIIAIDETEKITNKIILNKMPIEKAFQEFIKSNHIKNEEISKIVVTGIGQSEITGKINDIEILKVNEFEAIGEGATYLSKLEEALIISIGTGTSFVNVKNKTYTHIGGTGVGGGTLINLCKRFAGLNSFEEIEERIKKADISKVDLRLKDITKEEINELLPSDITVANFGKLDNKATDDDIILGILNMIFETIGMMGIFAIQNTTNKNIIVIGSITKLTYLKTVLNMLTRLQKVNFIIPKEAEWTATLGAIQLAKRML